MTRREQLIEILTKEEKSAQCKKCEFKFEERSKIRKPSKCPKCKSEWIMAPLFSIKSKEL